MYETLKQLLGLELEAKDLSFMQISLRGIVVFIAALVIVRSANKRFLSKMTALDAILDPTVPKLNFHQATHRDHLWAQVSVVWSVPV
jgi:hypothetical protein